MANNTAEMSDAPEPSNTTTTTPARTLNDAYKDLAFWLVEPAQAAQLQDRRVPQGPLIPPTNSTIWFNADMYDVIQRTFHRGVAAATDNSIEGPIIPTGLSNDYRPLLWDYHRQGYNAARRDNSAQNSKVVKTTTIKLPEPPRFSGNRHELEEFIKKLHIKFNMEQDRFPQDVHKIAYASSFLTGDASVWFSPYVDKDTGHIAFTTFEDFLTTLRKSYGDPNRIATAEREIQKLRQTGSIDLYYSKFKEYLDILGWTDGQKVYNFRLGLRENVKDLLINRNQYAKITNFEDFYINAREAENDLNIRSQEGRTATDPSFRRPFKNDRRSYQKPKANSNSTAYGTHSGPMDLSAAPRRPQASNKHYTRLSREEKEQRFKKGQCFYCKETGHFVSNCPKAKNEKPTWRKTDNRKALVARRDEEVVFSLGSTKETEPKN